MPSWRAPLAQVFLAAFLVPSVYSFAPRHSFNIEGEYKKISFYMKILAQKNTKTGLLLYMTSSDFLVDFKTNIFKINLLVIKSWFCHNIITKKKRACIQIYPSEGYLFFYIYRQKPEPL